MAGIYVQYGCGICAPDGWVNFDASPTLRFERLPVIGKLYSKNSFRFPANVRYGDIVKGLPIPANAADGVYASHVIEHLTLEDAYKALANSHAMLKRGRRFRLIVPDLRARAQRYFAQSGPDAAHIFIRSIGMGQTARPSGLIARLSSLFGSTLHLWMWDEASLAAALRDSGFSQVRRCDIGDSADPMFRQVEDEGRFSDDGARELAMEAVK